MFSQPLGLSLWAGPITAIATALLVLFTAYVLVSRRRKRRRVTPHVPHSSLPSNLEYEADIVWRG
jgi:hypothetical protein